MYVTMKTENLKTAKFNLAVMQRLDEAGNCKEKRVMQGNQSKICETVRWYDEQILTED